MLLGVIADDFTGASDIANTLAKGLPGQGGLRTAQFLNVPQAKAAGDIEAGVVALKSRSIPAAEAVAQSLAALRWLKDQGCRQIVFKYCSTFDSTPEGNIGPVAEALAVELDAQSVVVCPAFPAAGRTVYQGHLFVQNRLLNESGLENHPLNPMTDPDIRRWLTRQAKHPVGLIAWPSVRKGPEQISAELGEAARRGERLVIVDALTEEDIVAIGRASAGVRLLTGGSGIALGLPGNFISAGDAKGEFPKAVGLKGPEVILAGSCSSATRGQIEHHRRGHPAMAIDVDAVMRDAAGADAIVSFVLENQGRAPLVYSSDNPAQVKALQDRYGRDKVAHTLDRLFADAARSLVAKGIRRLVVAGGETSGAVVSALDLGALTVGPEIDPGVPVLVSDGEAPIALALKSGNFGAPEFFSKALGKLAGA